MLQPSYLCVETSSSIGLLFGSPKLDRLVSPDVINSQTLAKFLENFVVSSVDCCLQSFHLLLMAS